VSTDPDVSTDPVVSTDADGSGGSEGDPCSSPATCSDEAPICSSRTNACQDGSEGDACNGGGDCSAGASSICGPNNTCQDGSPGDACNTNVHCSTGSSICGPSGCQAGVEGDPCVVAGQCSGSAPLCASSGTCQDGSEGDTCADGDDCGASAEICGPADTCQDGSEGDACVDGADCGPSAEICGPEDMCQDGADGDPCASDADCAGGEIQCIDTQCVGVPAGFVFVPAGSFWMGSPDGVACPGGYPGDCSEELGRFPREGPLHEVTLTSPFYLAEHEVTQGEWFDLIGNNPSSFSGCASCPVEWVNWWEALEYVNRLSDAEGLATCYTLTTCTNNPGEDMECEGVTVNATDGNPYLCEGYRLPTEAEWEYAYRAGGTTAFYNGGITETGCGLDNNLDAIGWYCGNDSSTTEVVGQKDANAWGLYDMSGNVYEWVWDWYSSDYYSSSPALNPEGPAAGSYRVLRGGSWDILAQRCRAANRDDGDPGNRVSFLGFRPARSGP